MTNTHDCAVHQMTDPHRSKLVEGNSFFYEQAIKRLLSQFTDDDMVKEAERHSREVYEKMGAHFDPDIHDEAVQAEDAYFAGNELYQLLVDMKSEVRLALVAAMYHKWDKELRDWLCHEVRDRSKSDTVKRAVWRASLDELFDLMASCGFNVTMKPYYPDIDACRLVVNVFKHGDGRSLDDLSLRHPKFTVGRRSSMFAQHLNIRLIEYKHVNVTDEDFGVFSSAFTSFWLDVRLNVRACDVAQLPKWFREALSCAKKVL